MQGAIYKKLRCGVKPDYPLFFEPETKVINNIYLPDIN